MVPLRRGAGAEAAASAGYDPLFPPPPPRGGLGITMWRFLVWMLRTDAPRTLVVLGLELLIGLCPAATVWIVRRAFGDALGVFRGTLPAADLLRWLGVWAVIVGAQHALYPLLEVPLERLRQEMEDALQLRLQRKAARLRLEVFERPDFYDILGRAREAAGPGFFLNLMIGLFRLPQAAATIVALAAIVGGWSPALLAATVVAATFTPLAEIVQSRSRFFLQRRQTAAERMRRYLAQVLTSREAAKEVRTFDLAAWVLGRWEGLYWRVADAVHRQERAQSLARAGLQSLSFIGVGAGLGYAAWATATGGLQPGQFAAMLMALQGLQGAVGGFVGTFRFTGDRVLKIADLFVYLDLGPEEPEGGAAPPPLGADGSAGDIALEGVSFRYPQRLEPVLQEIHAVIRAGERVALVGENGSGKTTLVKVLTGLFRPTEGRVTYGGADVWGMDLRAVRDRQAAVFQDHVHYAFTLGENIGYGRAERAEDRAALVAAAARGGAEEVAAALPQGYGTLLTREFSGGTELSGGQWQRVAVSRGFMREAPLIVLDEPTAALDPQAEADVFRRFAAMADGRTAVLVSHRLGSARLCDRVLVLREGRLVEQGTHDELVAVGGEYARLWALQAQWYA